MKFSLNVEISDGSKEEICERLADYCNMHIKYNEPCVLNKFKCPFKSTSCSDITAEYWSKKLTSVEENNNNYNISQEKVNNEFNSLKNY